MQPPRRVGQSRNARPRSRRLGRLTEAWIGIGEQPERSSGSGTEHPLINIYCDGYRVATYGQSPNQVTGFNDSSSGCQGDTWRVVDVETIVSGGVTTCNVTALHPSGQTVGFDIRNNDTSF